MWTVKIVVFTVTVTLSGQERFDDEVELGVLPLVTSLGSPSLPIERFDHYCQFDTLEPLDGTSNTLQSKNSKGSYPLPLLSSHLLCIHSHVHYSYCTAGKTHRRGCSPNDHYVFIVEEYCLLLVWDKTVVQRKWNEGTPNE